jgi:hypothetical protein
MPVAGGKTHQARTCSPHGIDGGSAKEFYASKKGDHGDLPS